MQNSPSSALSPLVLALQALATLVVGAISSLITYLLTKPQQSAIVHKTDAEIRQIDSAILMKAYERLDDYEDIRCRQNETIADLENRNFDLEFNGRVKDAENKRLLGEIEILNLQVQKARAKGFLTEDRAPGSPNPAA